MRQTDILNIWGARYPEDWALSWLCAESSEKTRLDAQSLESDMTRSFLQVLRLDEWCASPSSVYESWLTIPRT
jgi:hypothetical protein